MLVEYVDLYGFGWILDEMPHNPWNILKQFLCQRSRILFRANQLQSVTITAFAFCFAK